MPASGSRGEAVARHRFEGTAERRHVVTDTTGLLVGLEVHGAGIQDRDGAPDVLEAVGARYPMLRHIFADGRYAGPKLRDALTGIGRWTFQIVKRPMPVR